MKGIHPLVGIAVIMRNLVKIHMNYYHSVPQYLLYVTQEGSRGRNLSLICSKNMMDKRGNDYYASKKSTPVFPWLSYSPLDPRFAGSNPAGIVEFFQSVKILEYDFLRKGSQAVGPMS